jgi:hypothetical protein
MKSRRIKSQTTILLPDWSYRHLKSFKACNLLSARIMEPLTPPGMMKDFPKGGASSADQGVRRTSDHYALDEYALYLPMITVL